jgi:pimeloyl-ACP methyl ester carboxylesterase
MIEIRKILVLTFIGLFIMTGMIPSIAINTANKSLEIYSPLSKTNRIVETYVVLTHDDSAITLTRYKGIKNPIIFIHGMGCNHLIYDWDENHSLARYLNDIGWDVWLLDLRTHDCDGDFRFAVGSDREYIDRYWDFDNTLLKIDVVTAVDFVKNKTEYDNLFLSGHSYGGYLTYAYAMIIGEENLSGIITTGASPYGCPKEWNSFFTKDKYEYGYDEGEYAFVKENGREASYGPSKLRCIFIYLMWDFLDHSNSFLFYENTTPYYIQKRCVFISDAEAAGVCVDMMFGGDPDKYHGDWVDPQTLYNYTDNLYKITVPFLAIAGDEDHQDPSKNIYKCYENVSSKFKEFYTFPKHSHMDLLMGNDCRELIFPKIDNFMNEVVIREKLNS